jgi:hypothetical protein
VSRPTAEEVLALIIKWERAIQSIKRVLTQGQGLTVARDKPSIPDKSTEVKSKIKVRTLNEKVLTSAWKRSNLMSRRIKDVRPTCKVLKFNRAMGSEEIHEPDDSDYE